MNSAIPHTADSQLSETKVRILDAAERLFAERGFDAASLRAITAAAGVNLAAVNYHFGSKEELIRAVFARKLTPLNRMRMELLDRHEAEAGGKPVDVEKILRALLEPAGRMSSDPAARWDNFRTLAGRMLMTPTVQEIFVRELSETVRRFRRAFQLACPVLPPEELFWRIYFTIGAMMQTLAAGPLLEMITEGRCTAREPEQGLERLIAYAAAGLRAAVPAATSRGTAPRPRTPRAAKPQEARKA